MNHRHTAAVGDYRRPTLQYVTLSRSLLLLKLLVALLALYAVDVGTAVALPADEMYAKLVGADEYADVDNVEWHHVKIVDGLVEEDHPIIMYKEDFVSEDFDPSKNRTGEAGTRHAQRKYKSIAHRRRNHQRHNDESAAPVTEKYRALKPQKMLFDVLPKAPLTTVADDSKFDPSKIRVEVISLTDDNYNNFSNNNNEPIEIVPGDEPSKQLLKKRPKKYHRRARRNAPTGPEAGEEHIRDKRNPFYRQNQQIAYGGGNWVLVPVVSQQQSVQKHSVSGKLWNALYLEVPAVTQRPSQRPTQLPTPKENTTQIEFGMRFGSENEQDKVVWGGGDGSSNMNTNTVRNDATERPPRRRRPSQSIFHNSNPEDADISFATRRPEETQEPAIPPPHAGSPSNTVNSIVGRPQTTRRPMVTMRPTSAPAATDVAVTNCMWAIVNCCSTRDLDVRYGCFEQYRCSGVFWDLNPCADPVRDNLVNFVNDFYD